MPGMSYVMFRPPFAEQPAGGMGEMQPEDSLGPRWSVTFEVDDVDAARQLALDAGGGATSDPWDFEYGHVAGVTGLDGEEFFLMTSKDLGDAAPTAP